VWKIDRGSAATKQTATRHVNDLAAGMGTAVTAIHLMVQVFQFCLHLSVSFLINLSRNTCFYAIFFSNKYDQ
jgi:hypothetical protein